MTKVKEVFAYNSKLEYIDKYENYSKCCDDLQVTSQHISESVTKSKKVKGFYFFDHKPNLSYTIYKTIFNTYMLRNEELNDTHLFDNLHSSEDFIKIIKVTRTLHIDIKRDFLIYRNVNLAYRLPFEGSIEEQKIKLYDYLKKYNFDADKMILEDNYFLDIKNKIYNK